MSVLNVAQMIVRVRRIFLEELGTGQSTDFIDESQSPNEIRADWDDACAEFHQTILNNAEASGRLEDHDNRYLQRYLQRWAFRIDRGTVEYGPVPTNMGRIIKVEVDGIRASRKSPMLDRFIRTWPSTYGPGKNEVFWILLSQGYQSPPEATDSTRRLRVYVYGDTLQDLTVAVPLVQMQGEMTFYRLLDPCAYSTRTTTDIEDPYADGPVHGTVARLLEKAQNTDRAQYHYGRQAQLANLLMPGPQQPQQGQQ